ncbi:WD40 repeat domain-containing serine/threonine protein kinase [Nocardiopsis xinjiangensis]|uniref:WD40 repeat domain-containing serine/threonine protein kinase n=1 Tax=Nocardiopsis xinjiangensis TaxID=124285 RepID=UPI0003452822|nr:WD40 repeat domain-containing serine/threonine protein kinase [Nocardiopsis xinjiangensis]
MKPLQQSDPSHIGPHRVLARLGAGGMGAVYLARTPEDRLAAVKITHRELAQDEGFRARFSRETRTAQMVRGPFTPAVLSVGAEGEAPWMATEYVPGPTLGEAVATGGPLPEGSLRVLTLGLARALQSVHASGIMHRDLKPGNVLLSPRGPQVIDFGIARAVEGTVLTKTGEAFGTPSYAAPETVLGHEQSAASDIFSLAGVVVFASCGEPPFGRSPASQVLQRVVSADPRLGALHAGTLRDLMARCMAKEPADRPTADELVRALSAEPLPPAEHGWLPSTVNEAIGDHERELRQVVHGAGAGSAPLPGSRSRPWLVAGAAATAVVLISVTAVVMPRPWEHEAATGEGEGEADTSAATDEASFPEGLYGMYFASDGDELYVHAADRTTVWDWREGELIDVPFEDAPEYFSFDLAASGHTATAGPGGVHVWDEEHEHLVAFGDGPGEGEHHDSVSFSADGSLLAFVHGEPDTDEATVTVWDWEADTVFWEEDVTAMSADLSPTGDHLALGHPGADPRLWVIDLAEDEVVYEYPNEEHTGEEGDGLRSLRTEFSPTDPLLAVPDDIREVTSLIDLSTGEIVLDLESPGVPRGLGFSPDGSVLLAGRSKGISVSGGFMWDVETGEELVSGETLLYKTPEVHPDEETIAVVESGAGINEDLILFLNPDSLRDTHQIG